MKIRDLIKELLEYNLDTEVEIYVCGKTAVVKKYVEDAEDSKWCLDEILEISGVEKGYNRILLKAEELC